MIIVEVKNPSFLWEIMRFITAHFSFSTLYYNNEKIRIYKYLYTHL